MAWKIALPEINFLPICIQLVLFKIQVGGGGAYLQYYNLFSATVVLPIQDHTHIISSVSKENHSGLFQM